MGKIKEEIENQRYSREKEYGYFEKKDSHCSKCPRLLTREGNELARKCDYCLGLRSVNDLYATVSRRKKESPETNESKLEKIRFLREWNETN